MAKKPAKKKAEQSAETAQSSGGLVSRLKDLQVGPIERPVGSMLKKPKAPK